MDAPPLDGWSSASLVCEATFLGLKQLPRELTAFEIEAFFRFTPAERQVMPAADLNATVRELKYIDVFPEETYVRRNIDKRVEPALIVQREVLQSLCVARARPTDT